MESHVKNETTKIKLITYIYIYRQVGFTIWGQKWITYKRVHTRLFTFKYFQIFEYIIFNTYFVYKPTKHSLLM